MTKSNCVLSIFPLTAIPERSQEIDVVRFTMYQTTGTVLQYSVTSGGMAVAVPRCRAEREQDWSSQIRVNRQTSLECGSFSGNSSENSKSGAIIPNAPARNNFVTYKGCLTSTSESGSAFPA
jgi:hypothetical protein